MMGPLVVVDDKVDFGVAVIVERVRVGSIMVIRVLVGQGLYVVDVAVDVTTVVFVAVAVGQPHVGFFVVKIGGHKAASLSVRFTAVTGTGPMV